LSEAFLQPSAPPAPRVRYHAEATAAARAFAAEIAPGPDNFLI
jgi:hypothetical protein